MHDERDLSHSKSLPNMPFISFKDENDSGVWFSTGFDTIKEDQKSQSKWECQWSNKKVHRSGDGWQLWFLVYGIFEIWKGIYKSSEGHFHG